MARYRHIDLSPRLLPVDLDAQLVPGTFAHAVHHLVDDLDLSAFDAHYRNDLNGAPAHAPSMLLKAVLLAYSQGLVSSRSIERACRDNVLFIAITGDAKPHFTRQAISRHQLFERLAHARENVITRRKQRVECRAFHQRAGVEVNICHRSCSREGCGRATPAQGRAIG